MSCYGIKKVQLVDTFSCYVVYLSFPFDFLNSFFLNSYSVGKRFICCCSILFGNRKFGKEKLLKITIPESLEYATAFDETFSLANLGQTVSMPRNSGRNFSAAFRNQRLGIPKNFFLNFLALPTLRLLLFIWQGKRLKAIRNR